MNKLKQYVWVWEWFAAAILVSFAITSVIRTEFLVFAFGCIFIIFGLFRVVPLIKTTESKLMKWLTFAEMMIEVFAGVALFVWSNKMNGTNGEEASPLFGYIVGAVLYIRGFMHFLGTSVKNEPTTFVGFLVNIALITVATIIISKGGFSPKALAWFFFAVIMICFGFLIWRGYVDYRNYRGNLVGESKTKKMKKSKEKEEEVSNPTSDEIKINIIPQEPEEKEKPRAEL